jgi:hypothetical protein
MATLPRIANGLAAAGGAGLTSQFPEFYQQYLQRLGGRLDQALIQEARIYEAAQGQGLAVEDYLRRFLESGDPVFQAEGRVIQAALADAEALRGALLALADAGPLERPFALFRYLDHDVLSATFAAFKPALPVTAEGLTYAAIGLLLGLLALALGERGGKVVKRRWQQRRLRRRNQETWS